MAEAMTELDLVVGSMITTRPEEDREAYEDEKEDVQDIQDLLREEGIVVDLLSLPGTEVWEGSIESFYDLYQLRRLAAHLERGEDITQVLAETSMDGEEVDPVLADIWDEEAQTKFPHLINHLGDSGSYYLPADFPVPIWVETDPVEEAAEDGADEEEDDMLVSLGSSIRLLSELNELDQLFREHKVPPGGYSRALDVLKTAAQQSVEHGLPIILW